ncbi:hypothetical protein OnM2_035033 [Erysiphe neolycopersici]|uniref:Putative zinc-finger domain-containing protein n=1 Tax=Erysiphe neolycopersici TaxID=212602 RepID=A0A420HXE3_9PEZI|nr:hypothetical protein OnM2_035033 [Erysiphe neolycopersici]
MSLKNPHFSLWYPSIVNNNCQRNFDSFYAPINDSINQNTRSDGETLVESVKSKLDEQDSTGIPGAISPYLTHRQSSDSYSPYVSPTVSDLPPKERVPMISIPTYQDDVSNEIDKFSVERLSQDLPKNGTHLALTKTMPDLKTLSERRKEAQEVILSLWPYGVRYETYLEEGFKKDILDELFKDLNIDNSEAPYVTPLHNNHLANEKSKIISKNHSNDVLPFPHHDELPIKATSNSAVPNIPTKPSEVIEKEKNHQIDMAERHKTLQTKMDALRKSRELRASVKSGIKSNIDQISGIKSQNDQNISSQTKKLLDASLNSKQALSSKINSDVPTGVLTQPVNGITSHTKLHTNLNEPEPTTSVPPASTLSSETPAIPGLFLISNLANSAISENSAKPRKRPVASDFDCPTVTPVPFKRPFGQNRGEQRVVINVSEDESEDEDITTEIKTQVEQEISTKTSNIQQNMSSASNSSGQKSFTTPTNLSTNPSSFPVKQSLLAPSILKQKQREIELMKQRIAAAEAQLKAKSTTVSVGTRQQSESSVFEMNENLDHDDVSPTELEVTQENAESVNEDIGPGGSNLTQNLTFNHENSTSKIESILEIKRRRKNIASKLPIIESEVKSSKSKLELLKIEISKIEAGLEKKLEERNRMTTEMKRLCEEEAFLPSLDDASNEITMNMSNLDPPDLCSHQDLDQPPLQIENTEIIINKLSSPDQNLLLPSLITSTKLQKFQRERSIMTDTTDTLDIDDDKLDKDNTTPNIKLKRNNSNQNHNFVNQELEDLIQKVNIIQADIKENKTSPKATTKNNCSLTPNQHTTKTNESLVEEGKQSIGIIQGNERPNIYEDDSDDYEPPDATSLYQEPRSVSPPFSPAPPKSVELIENDQTQSNVHKKLPQIGEPESINELQSHQNALTSQHMKDEPNMTLYSSDRYTPYQSSLKLYRAYRFHPNFKTEIAGGLRSLTYSHNIDANKEFCRFEVAGGFCNDSACSLQHFKTIKLPDDGIMAALGCPDEFTGDSREKFVTGLRGVLLDLRLRKVNDFDTIASEIIAYRAKFLGDQSRILSLEGIAI